ncbi:MAG: insulinase family protein [Oscillospiraceae bacterium]|nr:insulinase family protein [Oscillospiraceae bacterium]
MIEKIYNDIIKETCLKYVCESGTEVYMLPMKGWSTAVAQFTARFGSQDNAFFADGRLIEIPDGTAHYLEHKLFESEEKDAFSLFAQTGASCNAGTSFDYTQYYFSCADNFRKNLEILLGFVSEPYFTEENVEKERGIIGQEITMYRDNPSWRVFTNLLEGIYVKNPVRLDIAGTVESIAKITPQTLTDCYNAFYSPSNMFLCAAGNIDPEEIVDICEKKLGAAKPFKVETAECDEPYEVNRKITRLKMPVSKPIFEIGFKRPAVYKEQEITDYIYYNILLDMLFGSSSEFYEQMRGDGTLNDEWSVSVFNGRGYFFPAARGESENPELVLEKMRELFVYYKKNPPARELFERVKKATYGSLVKDFTNVRSVCNTLSEAVLSEVSPFCAIQTTASADYETLIEKLRDIDEENACISIVEPI